jgi:hypothetical protein
MQIRELHNNSRRTLFLSLALCVRPLVTDGGHLFTCWQKMKDLFIKMLLTNSKLKTTIFAPTE